MGAALHTSRDVRYEPDELPPTPLAFGMGAQQAVLCIAGIVLTPVIVVRAAGEGDTYLTWAVFAALLVSGLTTMAQAVRVGRIGAGYPLLMGTSGAFIAVCVTALMEGGPGLLATLVAISALFQFALSERLALLRRIITPTVAGTVIMLIAVTVMPIIFDMLADVPEGTSPAAAPASAVTTLVVIAVLALSATGVWRLWMPLLGLAAGCVVASFFGLYDVDSVLEAPWIGVPSSGWPGIDLEFGTAFWGLLPAFVFVTLIGATETIGDSIAIQRVSWRKPRAVDFRAVQGAVAADGVGNLLSGLAGTVPNTTYSTSIAITELTGVAARRVGVWIGIVFVAVAFFPKVAALLLAIPSPVAAAYITVLLSLLFVLGMRIVVQGGVDYRKATIAGIAFWIGVGFQNQLIFADHLGEWWGAMLGNGMTAGGLTAIALTLFMELTGPRSRRIETALNVEALHEITGFLREFASGQSWSTDAVQRLCSAGEETLLSLIRPADDAGAVRRLLVIARGSRGAAELEFIAAPGEENLEDRMVLLTERRGGAPAEREISLRLLRHYASSVYHQQYHDTDIVTVRVEGDARK
ncbi:MAG: purine/pyrimidine permease [Alphaproteobacteria bacterium]|nr:purine/pyrimidine permease [Alphaproteobacteria bacterium]